MWLAMSRKFFNSPVMSAHGLATGLLDMNSFHLSLHIPEENGWRSLAITIQSCPSGRKFRQNVGFRSSAGRETPLPSRTGRKQQRGVVKIERSRRFQPTTKIRTGSVSKKV